MSERLKNSKEKTLAITGLVLSSLAIAGCGDGDKVSKSKISDCSISYIEGATPI
jgi:hypothetical protein